MSTQVPPPEPPQQPAQLPRQGLSNTTPYFIGVVIGLLPLIALFGLTNTMTFGLYVIYAGLGLYAAILIGSIVCLVIERIRFVGYGLLTMVFATPVIFFISCVTILSTPHP